MSASAQSLLAAYDAGEPLTITVPNGGKRIIAGLLIVENGLVFADVGWSWWGNVRHPFHYVSGGDLYGLGPWYVGLACIERMPPGDPLSNDQEAWLKFEAERSADPKSDVFHMLRRFAKEQALQ